MTRKFKESLPIDDAAQMLYKAGCNVFKIADELSLGISEVREILKLRENEGNAVVKIDEAVVNKVRYDLEMPMDKSAELKIYNERVIRNVARERDYIALNYEVGELALTAVKEGLKFYENFDISNKEISIERLQLAIQAIDKIKITLNKESDRINAVAAAQVAVEPPKEIEMPRISVRFRDDG